MSDGAVAAALVAAVGCGLVGGVFFAFSGFVMPGLARLAPAQGVAAMQSINRTAVRAPLMILMFGTAAVCVGLVVWAVGSWGDAPAAWTLAGAVVYLVGTVLVTIAGNVPLNNALDRLDPAGAEAAPVWARYLRAWTGWNHVRTAAGAAAAAALVLAIHLA